MKRYRIYSQDGARFSKINGRYRSGKYTIEVPRCGCDDLIEAQRIAHGIKLVFDKSQICILDFEQRGIIVEIL
jgi:hypothetical protein